MKNVYLILLFVLLSNFFYGQTLVHYGNQTISRNEFLMAFRKNNLRIVPTDSAYRNYLNLYILYKLKVQAAYDEKLDTLPAVVTEMQNLKRQLFNQYSYDEESLNRMAKEAFTRSQHDLRISYIFVASTEEASPADTAKAWKKINAAYKALKNQKDFNEVALQYSEDPFVKANRGDLGYITVFDLPYSIENLAYHTPPGKFSPVLRTSGGYIILKNAAERHAIGHTRIAQIILNIPGEEATVTEAQFTRLRADSIYQALITGADFNAMTRTYMSNHLSYQQDDVLLESGIAAFEEQLEKTNFYSRKEGDYSEYYDSFNFHIVKRIKRKPPPAVVDKKIMEEMKEAVKSDPRIAVSRQLFLQTVLKQTGFRQNIPKGNSLWDYTDSVLDEKPPSDSSITNQLVIFQFPEKKYTVGDWIEYRKSLIYFVTVTHGKTNSEILDLFRENVAFEYYKENLGEYNPSLAAQINEFRDVSVLYEIMQRQVWNRASADTAGLRKYFETHAKNYLKRSGTEATNSVAATTSPETFGEARERVITDYQNELEKKWIEELKKKYPVTVSENVFKTLPKQT
jgi:peptidyl-prolyl cis-trans isomerase SurA